MKQRLILLLLLSAASTAGAQGLVIGNGGSVTCSASGGGTFIYPSAGIVVSTGSAWGTPLTAPAGAIVGTTDAQSLTNKTLDGVTNATMGFVDPTSSIQTQLDSKQGTIALTTTGTSGLATWDGTTLNVPNYAVAAGPSVTGFTGATVTAASGFYLNQNTTTTTAVTATLPTPAVALQICLTNTVNGSNAAETGALKVIVANTGTQSIIYQGAVSASGYIQSAGAAGDSACVVGISTTRWLAFPSGGSWTLF